MRRMTWLFLAVFAAFPMLAKADDIHLYGASWADSSGKDGKGGVSIVWSGDKRQFLLRTDPCKEKIDSKTYGEHPNWVVFDSDGNNDNCLSFEFTWITDTDKHWDKMWAGGGLAFNNSWTNQDFSQAKALVLYAKTNSPGVDFNVNLTGAKDGQNTGTVKLSDYAEGKQIGTNWTRIVIPMASIPNLAGIDLTQVKILTFNLLQGYPENKPVYVHFDKIYFTDAALITPVEDLGWVRVPGGIQLIWGKADDSGVLRYLVTVDGKVVGRVTGAGKRSVKLLTQVLGAAGSHVLGVAADNGKTISSYESVTVTSAPASVVSATVSLAATASRPISPYLWGFNYMDSDSLKKLGGTVNRWGGNDTTGYNWKDDADNHGADWTYLNTGGPLGIAEKDKRYYKFVTDSQAGGATPMITIPITGWVAKVPPADLKDVKFGSFPTSLFPGQKAGKEPGLGEGEYPDGKKVWNNDPNYNYLPSDPVFQQQWVKTLIADFGSSAKGGIRLYQMDNEPGLWRFNHRDVFPKGVGYDELVDLNAKYAAAVKAVDPGAQVVGWTAWGVMELAGSNWDYMPGGVKGYQAPDNSPGEKWTDRKAHGDIPQVAFFLQEMAKRSKKAGVRLIDYLDDHGFPEVWGTDGKGNKVNVLGDFPYDPVLTPKQFEAMRIFWDPTFESPDSWCANTANKPYLWDPWVGLIPKLKKVIAENYPGTKLSMTEYYPASKSYYHGGLLEAVNLGIFMREGMDMACDWDGAHPGNYVFLAHQLFSNYDGQGHKVGGGYVNATSSSADLYAFGAKDATKTYAVLVNKNHDADIDTTLALPAAASVYHTYTLSQTSGKRIYDSGPVAATGGQIKLDVPAFSAMLVVAQ